MVVTASEWRTESVDTSTGRFISSRHATIQHSIPDSVASDRRGCRVGGVWSEAAATGARRSTAARCGDARTSATTATTASAATRAARGADAADRRAGVCEHDAAAVE